MNVQDRNTKKNMCTRAESHKRGQYTSFRFLTLLPHKSFLLTRTRTHMHIHIFIYKIKSYIYIFLNLYQSQFVRDTHVPIVSSNSPEKAGKLSVRLSELNLFRFGNGYPRVK